MIGKRLEDMTYNDYAALSLGEAQALKRLVDETLRRRDDIIFDQGIELAELKGEPSPYDGT